MKKQPTVLFVNGCPRGEESRTLALAECFLSRVKSLYPDVCIQHCDLNTLGLAPLTLADIKKKDKWCDNMDWSQPELAPARDFQRADAVVIAAPYWDYSFPAIVKVWVENIWVRNLTFVYEGASCKGLCQGKSAVYITTSGSPLGENDWGTLYIRAVMQALGIPEFYVASAQGLDLEKSDVPALMEEAKHTLDVIAGKIVRDFY